jgi:prepilin-type N-terminal cleavage/methylation domain-containing protein
MNASRGRRSAGFTLVELLVVIGIIAILAGVALGPITRGITKAKESAALQTTRSIALAEFQYANDNGQYPDGTDAGAIGAALISGNYISDPGIFYISGDTAATRLSGTGTMAATNSSYDFMGVNGTGTTSYAGVSTSAPDQLPLVWSPDVNIPAIPTGTSAAGVEFAPNNPLFGKDGIAVCYHSNSAFFRAPINIAPAAGAYPKVKGDAMFIDSSFNPGGVTYAKRFGAAQY